MKKRRGKVLKRLCGSSYYCGSRNSDRKNAMRIEERLEPTAVFIQRITAAVSELKDHLQQDYERTYPSLGEIIRIVLNEEEAKAWELSFFPHLFAPRIPRLKPSQTPTRLAEIVNDDFSVIPIWRSVASRTYC